MPTAPPFRRRTPSDVSARPRRRRANPAVVLLAGLSLTVAACSSAGSDPAPAPTPATPASTLPSNAPAASPATAGSPLPSLSSPSGVSALLDYPHLFAAMAVVPVRAAVVSFTDLDLVKKRLGYAGVTSASPTRERFDFWERARADGAMFTGTRLYDASSQMAIDYGWTGEDVAWEVDFAVTEQGCLRSMLCQTAHGYVLGLRPDLDWGVVTRSLRDNGFVPDGDPDTFRSDDPGAPFALVHLIPELHAVAGGNPIGVQRLTEVVDGAPPFGPKVGAVYDRLGTVESLHASTGCVDLAATLGPDSTSDDVTAFLRKNPISGLAPAVSTIVAVSDRRTATIEVEAGAGASPQDVGARLSAMRTWPGLQSGTPFEAVADVSGQLNGDYESFTADIHAMPTFRATVITDDAPWALCPARETR